MATKYEVLAQLITSRDYELPDQTGNVDVIRGVLQVLDTEPSDSDLSGRLYELIADCFVGNDPFGTVE